MLKGIDVSEQQGKIDWKAVKKQWNTICYFKSWLW